MDIPQIGAFIAIVFAGLGVTFGQSILAMTSLDVLGRNPRLYGNLLVFTILGIALVESSAIYGLIIAMKILSSTGLDMTKAIIAGLSIGVLGGGVGFCQGKIVSTAIEALNRNPEGSSGVLQFMILTLALVESISIYGLIVAYQILS